MPSGGAINQNKTNAKTKPWLLQENQGEINKKRMYQGDAPPMGSPATPSAPSTTTELERLARLRADGVLTEEEFQAQKAKILGQG